MEKFLQRVVSKEDLPVLYQELKKFEHELDQYLRCDCDALYASARHLLRSGGKRMRPAIFLLGSRFGPDYDLARLRPMAMSLEVIHIASLVHDDVVDASQVRHGRPTVKAKWGNEVSVYTGDYLIGKAMELVTSYHDPFLNDRLITVAAEMCRGELAQMENLYKLDGRVASYIGRIKRKTAMLLSASCELGAYLAHADAPIVAALGRYGSAIGTAFQIIDDILDYSPDEGGFGKLVGGDVRQGLSTLPLIYALESAGPGADEIRRLFPKREKTDAEVARIVDIVHGSGAMKRSRLLAQSYIHKAKQYMAFVPECQTKQYFIAMADFVIERDF